MARPVSKKGARKGATPRKSRGLVGGTPKAPSRKSRASVKSAAKKAAKPAAHKAAPKAAPKPPPRRPPEIPAARWAKLGERQKRRYEGFYKLHPGAPLYRARGKQAGESLTLAQRREERIQALAERQSYRGGNYQARDADSIAASYRAVIRDHGWTAFNNTERLIRERQKGQGRITSDELGYDWDDYDGEDSELFYN